MAKHHHHDPEKISHTETTHPGHADPGHTDPGQQEHTRAKPVKKKSPFMRGFNFWSFLIAYTICCIALSVILAKVINGFNAAESTTPRYINVNSNYELPISRRSFQRAWWLSSYLLPLGHLLQYGDAHTI
jgi:hypothetical protein